MRSKDSSKRIKHVLRQNHGVHEPDQVAGAYVSRCRCRVLLQQNQIQLVKSISRILSKVLFVIPISRKYSIGPP